MDTCNQSLLDISNADMSMASSNKSGTQESTIKSLSNAPVFKPTKNFQPSLKPNAAIPSVSAFGSNGEKATSGLGLESLSLNNDFTPSTPYVHKFRTELCKNFELYGKCKYGDEVSKIHDLSSFWGISPSFDKFVFILYF